MPPTDPLTEITNGGSNDALLEYYSLKNGVDPELARRLMSQESRGHTNAVSPKGAQGLMQLMPGTAKQLGVTDPFDVHQNLDAGTKYLRQQLDEFGDPNLALAAYNAGPGAVRKFGNKVPPYAETQNYVKAIGAGYEGSGYAQDPLTQITQGQQAAPSTDPLTELTSPEAVSTHFGTSQPSIAIAGQTRFGFRSVPAEPGTVPDQPSGITAADLEWHLGIPAAQAAGWFEGLSKRKQAEVYREVSTAVAWDQQKKDAGVTLEESPSYQAGMRKHLGVIAPVQATGARQLMQVPGEPGTINFPQTGGALSVGSVMSQARQQGDPRSQAQFNDSQLMEQAVKNVSAFSLSPTGNIRSLYHATTKGIEGGFEADVQEEFQRLKDAQARENTPEMIAARKRIGAIPENIMGTGTPSPRGVASAFQRFGGETVKALAGAADVGSVITGLGPIADYFGVNPVPAVRDYLNQRGNVLIESASMPMNAQGQAIERSLPEKATDAVTGLGLSLAQLILLKKATGLNLGPLMAIEATLKNSDRPVSERVPDAAEAYVMGKVLDQHLSRPLSALAFGGPTAVSTGLAYAQGNMSLEDALLQTGIQAGAGAILGGKPKGGGGGDGALRTVPAEPGAVTTTPATTPTSEVERQIQNVIQPSTAKVLVDSFQQPDDFQFALERQLRDVIDFRPKKGTTKARRAEIDNVQTQAKAELARRASEGDQTQQAIAARIEATRYSPTPRFDVWAENETGQRVESIPQDELLKLGEQYRAQFKDAPPPPALREFPPLPTERTQANAEAIRGYQGQLRESGQAGKEGEGVGRTDVYQEGQGRQPVQSSEVAAQGQVGPRIIPMVDGKFRIAIEGSTGTTYRTFNTQAEAESAIAKLPRVPAEPAATTPQTVEAASQQPVASPALNSESERLDREARSLGYDSSRDLNTQEVISAHNDPNSVKPEVLAHLRARGENWQKAVAITDPAEAAKLNDDLWDAWTRANKPAEHPETGAIAPSPGNLERAEMVVKAMRARGDDRADAVQKDIAESTLNEHQTLEQARERDPEATQADVDEANANARRYNEKVRATLERLKSSSTPEQPVTKTEGGDNPKVVRHKDPALDGAKVIGKKDGSKFLVVEKPDGSTTTIQNPHGPLGNERATVGKSVPAEPLKPIPLLSVGNEGTASTERGNEIAFRYAIVEARDPVTSHDEFQQPNPRFPEEAQPRDRSRVASAAQINEIATNPRPAELADSPKVAHGAPWLDENGITEVGNGRINGLRQMYRTGGETAERYRQFVIDNAARLGLDPEKAKAADEPLLTRIRTTPLSPEERVQFVNEGNEQGGARMSAPEQASADAKQISGQLLSIFRPTESGEINTAANHGFIQAFMRDVINPADRGEYVDARGAPSQAGITRIRNAIFARAYGDSPEGLRALEKIAESPDNNIRNITNALLQRAGGFAGLKEGIADGTRYDSLDVTGDLTKALSKMSALREQGQTVTDYLNQGELFDPDMTPLQRQMLNVLDEYKRSGNAISKVLGNYLELSEAAGNPNQVGLFGTKETPPDSSDLFEIAARKVAEDANTTKGKPSQADLYTSQGVPPEPATSSDRASPPSSAAGSGNQGGPGLFEANQSAQSAGGAESSPLGFGRGRVDTPPPLPQTEPELRDVQRQMTPGSGNTHGEVVDGLLSLALPSAKSPAHLRAAEILGSRIGEMNRRAESASSALGKWITKFYKLGVDRADVEPKDNAGVQFASAMSSGGKIDPVLEPAAKMIKTLFDGRLRLLEEAGVPLQSVRDNYFPGMWTRESRVAFNAALEDAITQGIVKEGDDINASTAEQRQWVRDRVNQYMEQGNGSDRDMLSYLTRRPLAGKESFKKEKVFDDILTAQEFGLRPNSNNPAEIVKVKLSEIDRSIMAHQHFQDLEKAPAAPQFADSWRALLRDRGVTGDKLNESVSQIQRISPYEQVPQGWIKINDKYGTIYGPPTIEVAEHIDKAVYQGLLDVANKLGISHERVAALKGGNLGLSYQGESRIQTKFATETSVMAHEVGHQLDAKYDLWNNLLRTQPKSGEPGKGFQAGRSELRDIADLTERGKAARSKEEKIAQVLEAYIHAPERMQEVAPRVYKWFDNFVKTTPELAPLADIKPGIALQKLTSQKYVGLPILGYRIVPQPVGDILNNYLSSSLYNSQYFGKPFKAWMATASVLNQSQLGVGSAFHASFTSGDVQTAAGANVIKDIYGVLRGNRDVGDIANSVGKWTTAIVRTPIIGDQVLNAWRNPDGVMDPKIAQVARAVELAQGGFKLEAGLKTEQTDKMVSDWYSGRKLPSIEARPGKILPKINLGAIARSPIAATELMARPIMEWLVPREKGGAFADMAWRIIEQNPGKSLEELTPEFRTAWNRIDGRLGQVRYDRIFANNIAKNVTQGLIRAPGWSGGTLAELGGAFKDLGSFAKEWAQTGKAPQELPDRVAYGMSLLISTAVVNGALTYAFTGQHPRGMDFFAFRDGNKDKDGNETRLLIPSYMKDILAYYEEGPSALVSKAHPLISLVNDVVVKNKDYFGTEIRDPHDPYYKQGEEVGKYVLKAFEPFWIRGVQRQQEQGGGYGRMAASYAGVMPAPSYLIQSEATKDLNQMIKDKLPAVRTPPTDRQEAMKDIIAKRRLGESTGTDLAEARQEGLVNKRDTERMAQQGRIDPMQSKMESVYRDYGLTGVLDWYERHADYMDPEMKTDAQKVIRKARLSLAQHPENLRGTPAERQILMQRINSALGLKSVPMAPPNQGQNVGVPAP